MSWLEGKTAIIIGERDGVQAPSIAKCCVCRDGMFCLNSRGDNGSGQSKEDQGNC
jgi:hypothetical protein